MLRALAIIAASVFIGASVPPDQNATQGGSSASDGARLRRLALTTGPDEFGFKPSDEWPLVYGLITDWNLGEHTATILSLRDGTTSLYTTSSFGIIGGQQHDRVRQASTHSIREAAKHLSDGKPTKQFPYPEDGRVHFYLLTYNGIRRITGAELQLEQRTHRQHALYQAVQNVITELRRASDK